jgi:hypothetical protein
MHLTAHQAWLYVAFNPSEDAKQPISRICMMRPQGGGQHVACTLWKLELPSDAVHTRALEVSELARWALRQPQYSPNENNKFGLHNPKKSENHDE